MAAELGLLSLTQLQKLAQQKQQQPPSATWNYTGRRPATDDDDSWEVRAFAEDTGNAMGTTWPPRSYTCSFCRREFRSAQALGGHMNVHRRDRARLRQSPQGSDPSIPSAATSSPPLIFPSTEFVAGAGAGLCLFYPIPNSGSAFTPAISPYVGASLLGKVGMGHDHESDVKDDNEDHGVVVEELDLELRLGW